MKLLIIYILMWQDNLASQSYRRDEGEKLLTTLHRTATGHHSLTIAGTARVTRSFAVSVSYNSEKFFFV